MAEHAGPRRDLVGYGAEPPTFSWPGGARLAVSVVLNYEEGSERNPMLGDSELERLVEASYQVPPGERELFMESTYEFGSRVGVWRLLDALDEHSVVPTIYAASMALEHNPAALEAFKRRGCDFVGHGYRWIPHTGMTREEEREHIRHGVTTLEQLSGQTVRGWFTRPPNTVHTRELLAEQGVMYDCGAVNDDIPYYEEVGGRPFMIVPYSLDINDIRFWKGQMFTGRDFEAYARDSFDELYEESARTPRMMSIGLHPRVIARPGRIGGLRRLLAYIRSFDDVWIAGRDEIASFWAERFPAEGLWNWPEPETASEGS